MFHKPTVDLFIDDKGIDVEVWKKQIPGKRGIVAKAFDLIHPGYVRLFKEAATLFSFDCALHENPALACPFKMTPVQSVEERKEILLSMRDVDAVVVYQAEDTFISYLDDYDIRFLGSDY